MSAELQVRLEEEEEAPPADRDLPVEILPTASKTDLLFACTWLWGKRARRLRAGDRTRFGSAYHAVLEGILGTCAEDTATIAERYEVQLDELEDRIKNSLPILLEWLRGANANQINFRRGDLITEISVAYHPTTGEARLCGPPDPDTHEYTDRRPGEIPGTVDLAVVLSHETLGRVLLVLDHKSGWNVAADWQPRTPAEAGQLRTLALALSTHFGPVDTIIVAFFHAPATGLAIVLEDQLVADDLAAHRKALRAAMGNVGNGWMRPGDWCTYCPAWDQCPTQRSALIELKRGPGPLTREKVGDMHEALAVYDALREKLRDQMRAWVTAHGPGVRRNGMIVDIVEKEVTNLSQASVVRALGPLKGAKELKRLEKLGCIEKTKRKELRAHR